MFIDLARRGLLIAYIQSKATDPHSTQDIFY